MKDILQYFKAAEGFVIYASKIKATLLGFGKLKICWGKCMLQKVSIKRADTFNPNIVPVLEQRQRFN